MEIPVMTSFPPTIGDCYGNGWRQLWKFFLELLLIGIVAFLFSLPLGLLSAFGHVNLTINNVEDLSKITEWFNHNVIYVLGYSVLVINPLGYGVKFAYLKAARGEKVEVRDMFLFTSNYINCVLANLLSGFIIGIGFVFLILPGIYFACKLAFVPYLVIDKRMDAIGAIKASWNMTHGHSIDIFVLGLIAILVGILGFVALIIGLIPAIMWIRMAFASMYHAVERMQAPKI